MLLLTLFTLSIVLQIYTRRQTAKKVELTVDDLEEWAIIDGEYVEFTPDEIVAKLRNKVADR